MLSWPGLARSQTDVGGNVPASPYRQLLVLALVRICEPIAFMSIFPYAYYMVQSFSITSDPDRIAIYVGLITSAFAFAEFSSGVAWGRISDRIGRKPVLLAGLVGTALSMIVFGFARNLPMALLARALGGLLNGNMGVLQTTVAELVTAKEHQPRAFSIMPFVWCLGSVIGPTLGGLLARPAVNYPLTFRPNGFFDRHPFLLPNLICTGILVVGVLVGLLFLEETHHSLRHKRDHGLEAGNWLLRQIKRTREPASLGQNRGEKSTSIDFSLLENVVHEDEELPEYSITDKDELPGYRTTDGTPRQSSSRSASPGPWMNHRLATPNRHDLRSKTAFTRHVVPNIAAFGILAYHSISFDQLMPVFLSEPVSKQPASLPIHFSGGFGYSTKRIGWMLAVQGLYSMFAQLLIFPIVARKLGSLNTFRLAISLWPLLYLVVPYMVLLPHFCQEGAAYSVLLLKMTAHVLAFPSLAIVTANSAPSKDVLGLVNGAAASTASLARALGPTVTGAVHTWGLSIGVTGIAWWFCGIICLLGAIESFWMHESRSEDQPPKLVVPGQDSAAEALLDPAALEAAMSANDDDSGSPAIEFQLLKSASSVSCCELLNG